MHALLQPMKYISQVPGKKVRGKIASAFNHWLGIPQEKLTDVIDIIDTLHNSSLLLDDIQDNSVLRRGIPVAHSIYGIASTINGANYSLFLALEKVLRLQHPQAADVYTEQLLELHRGQGMEIFWRDNGICPTEEEYMTMTLQKTGGLLMLAVRLMQLFSEDKRDFSDLAGTLGIYFQIRDDYCNLCSQEYTENKSYCEDLTEGKYSFPVIHAIHSRPDDNQIIQILRKRTQDREVKKYCVGLLSKFGSLIYTRNTLEILEQSTRSKIDQLGYNPQFLNILDSLNSWRNSDVNIETAISVSAKIPSARSDFDATRPRLA